MISGITQANSAFASPPVARGTADAENSFNAIFAGGFYTDLSAGYTGRQQFGAFGKI